MNICVRTGLGLLVSAIGCSSVLAGHIEVSADLRRPTDGPANCLAGNFRAVFDTDAAPTIGGLGQLVFNAVRCDLSIPIEPSDGEALPFSVGAPDSACDGFDTAHLEYFPGSDLYSITVSRTIDGQAVTMSLAVENPVGAFDGAMTSLPDAPGDFGFGGSGLQGVFVNLDVDAEAAFAIWTTSSSFGAFSFRAREMTIESEPLCSEADLAAPFGVLNLQDVFAYLALFNLGCN